LYWAESATALQLGAWWWFVPPGLAVALIGTALVLLNTGIDELGNPRLRDVGASQSTRPADPTPVWQEAAPPRGPLTRLAASFSRNALLSGQRGRP
jgi:peptide/nickel transport system permease protein